MQVPPPTVSVTVPVLRSLIIAATVDAKTGTLTYSTWRSRATAALPDPPDGPGWVLLMVDLDRFADLNTRFGHLAVDRVLASVAAALHRASGPGALVGRFGGDEFVILAPARTADAGRVAADCVRQAVAELPVTVLGPAGPVRVDGITVSIGTAHDRRRLLRRDPDAVLTAMLWAADQALYEAKRLGGDAVRSYRPAQ